jgi:hypothetical protein
MLFYLTRTALVSTILLVSMKWLRNNTKTEWEENESVPKFFLSTPVFVVILGLLLALKIPLDIYLPRPTVFQISTNTQEYIVESYNPLFGLSFECGSSIIYPSNATINTIPRGTVVQKATYCK